MRRLLLLESSGLPWEGTTEDVPGWVKNMEGEKPPLGRARGLKEK
jgi:hypothetical protein